MCAEVEFGDDPTALYRLYDSDGALLYVGITFNPKVRMEQHAADQPWWPEVARKTMQWLSRAEASAAETLAIGTERPKYNKRRVSSAKLPSRPSQPCTCDADRAARWAAGERVELLPGMSMGSYGPNYVGI